MIGDSGGATTTDAGSPAPTVPDHLLTVNRTGGNSMNDSETGRLGWLHLSRPRENWHRLTDGERDALYAEFARIRQETASRGAEVFGPYMTRGFEAWSRFVYFEFPDLATLFRREDRLQAIDYMNYVD